MIRAILVHNLTIAHQVHQRSVVIENCSNLVTSITTYISELFPRLFDFALTILVILIIFDLVYNGTQFIIIGMKYACLKNELHCTQIFS